MADLKQTEPRSKKLNRYQECVLKIYAGGDYAYMADMSWAEALLASNSCGDTMVKFLLLELYDIIEVAGGTDSRQVALDRIDTAITELDEVWCALNDLPYVPENPTGD